MSGGWNRTAHDEGLPAYAVLTNRQLLALIRAAPANTAALLRVEGLGNARAQRVRADRLLARKPRVASSLEP